MLIGTATHRQPAKRRWPAMILGIGISWLQASLAATPARVDEKAIGLFEQAPADWLSNGRTYAEQRYSPLSRVDARNVSRLGLAWQASLHSSMFGIEATPLVANGVIYTTSSYSRVFAFDARTGRELWMFDPNVSHDRIRYGCCFPVNRGVALWKGKVYVAAYDGRLIALDAATGKTSWEVNTTGESLSYTITGAPRVVDGKVIIGNAGSDLATRGFFSAYDAENGRLAWRFYVVPDDPRKPVDQPELTLAARTWALDRDWSKPGDGNPWDSFSYDPQTALLYVGTGNGGWVDQPGNIHKGDELFVSSILAIHVRSGRMTWYYQTTPGDIWDYDATQNMVLADLEVGGGTRKVLMQASKNGFFYVVDRVSGQLISAEKYVRVNWAQGIDPKTGRPIVDPRGNYAHDTRLVFPSGNGGHNWPGMAFDPEKKLAFIPARDSGGLYSVSVPTWFYHGYAPELSTGDVMKNTHGALIAWDPVRQQPAWQVVLKTVNNGGVLATAGGLVVQGTQDGFLRFYSADDGRLLHEVFTGTGIVAPPVTYELDGMQYFAFAAGWTGFNPEPAETDAKPPYVNDARLIVLKLGGTKVPVAARTLRAPFLADQTRQDPSLVAQGAGTYLTHCAICHGHVGEETLVPDLRRMPQGIYENFRAIVLDGLLKDAGMASFTDVLQPAEVDAIRAFVVDWAQRSRRGEASAAKMPVFTPSPDASLPRGP
jgi:quinohemoprotein ethanol dehydrogenase